jgi:hypothetical protein
VHRDPRTWRRDSRVVDAGPYVIKTAEDAIDRAEGVLAVLGMLTQWKLAGIRLEEDKAGLNGGLETMAMASVTFEQKKPEADFLWSPPTIAMSFDRIDGRLFFYSHEDVQYKVDSQMTVSLAEAKQIAERYLLEWHVAPEWRVVKSSRIGHCMDFMEKIELGKKKLPEPERFPAYPAYRFELSSPDPSFIVVRATDGKVICQGLIGGGFGD